MKMLLLEVSIGLLMVFGLMYIIDFPDTALRTFGAVLYGLGVGLLFIRMDLKNR